MEPNHLPIFCTIRQLKPPQKWGQILQKIFYASPEKLLFQAHNPNFEVREKQGQIWDPHRDIYKQYNRAGFSVFNVFCLIKIMKNVLINWLFRRYSSFP